MPLKSENSPTKPVVGVSACLMGEAVRYDGADKRHALLIELLSRHLELQSFCPEIAAGLGVPRPPVRLEKNADSAMRAKGRIDASLDVTDKLIDVSTHYLRNAQKIELCGFIFQSRSPSCGLHSTPIYCAETREQDPLAVGSGIFAGLMHAQLGHLIGIEDTWLYNKNQCYLFLAAVILTRARQFSGAVDPALIMLISDKQPGLGISLEDQIAECLEILLDSTEQQRSSRGFSTEALSAEANKKAALCRRLGEYFET